MTVLVCRSPVETRDLAGGARSVTTVRTVVSATSRTTTGTAADTTFGRRDGADCNALAGAVCDVVRWNTVTIVQTARVDAAAATVLVLGQATTVPGRARPTERPESQPSSGLSAAPALPRLTRGQRPPEPGLRCPAHRSALGNVLPEGVIIYSDRILAAA